MRRVARFGGAFPDRWGMRDRLVIGAVAALLACIASLAQAQGTFGSVPSPPDVVPPSSPAPPSSTVVVPVLVEPTPEEREFNQLLADLQRYGGFSPDDVRRELAAQNQALSRSRADAVRIRVAVLYTMTRNAPQDDQRALALFETVIKSSQASVSLRQLAGVLSVQVAERVRAVKDEQTRSEAALQKLEALRAMERSLLRDRVRSGGGGGGAGSGGN